MEAYVLIQTEGREPIGDLLRTISGVVEADDLRGPYDAIALIDSRSAQHPSEAILDAIRDLPGVTRILSAPLVASAVEAA